MEKMSYGWCNHVRAFGYYTAERGTVLRISETPEVFIRWVSKTECLVFCGDCYDKTFGDLVQFRKDPTKFIDQQYQVRDGAGPVATRVGGDMLPWTDDDRVSEKSRKTN